MNKNIESNAKYIFLPIRLAIALAEAIRRSRKSGYKRRFVFKLSDESNLQKAGLLKSTLINNPSIEYVNHPTTYPSRFRRYDVFSETWIHRIDNCYYDANTHKLFLERSKDKLVIEAIGSLSKALFSVSLISRIRSYCSHLYVALLGIDECINRSSVAPILVVYPTTFFHWIYEVIPSIIQAKAYHSDTQVLSFQRLPMWAISSAHLLAAAEPITLKPANTFLHLYNVLVPTRNAESGPVSISTLMTLRSKLSPETKYLNLKIYISRSKAKSRKVSNEDELANLLSEHGYQIIHLEDLPFTEQLSLFKSAKSVIGMHGAGLSGIFACQQGTQIIELFPADFLHYCYANIAHKLSLDYHYLHCEDDATIDLRKFSFALNRPL